MSSPRVRVELGPGFTGNHIWVGDTDITNLVTAVRIECSSNDGPPIPTVSLDLMPGAEIRVDGELLEAIQPVLTRRPEVQSGQVVAHQVTDEIGKEWALVYDAADVEGAETPIDVHDVTQPGDECYRRELGQAHLVLHLKEGARTKWVPANEVNR